MKGIQSILSLIKILYSNNGLEDITREEFIQNLKMDGQSYQQIVLYKSSFTIMYYLVGVASQYTNAIYRSHIRYLVIVYVL